MSCPYGTGMRLSTLMAHSSVWGYASACAEAQRAVVVARATAAVVIVIASVIWSITVVQTIVLVTVAFIAFVVRWPIAPCAINV